MRNRGPQLNNQAEEDEEQEDDSDTDEIHENIAGEIHDDIEGHGTESTQFETMNQYHA